MFCRGLVIQIGADGTECDVQLTKDNIITLFHDETLNKSTNCEGFVSSKNWNEINSCHYSWINSTNLNIISLQSFIDKIENKNNFIFSLDVKLWRDENEPYNNLAHRFAQAINEFAIKNNLSENIMVESRDTVLLNTIELLNPKIKRVYYAIAFKDANEITTKHKLNGVVIKFKNITKQQVQVLHQRGLFVTVFNMQTNADNKKAIALDVDYFESDKTKELLKDFNRYKGGHLNDWKDK